MSTAATTSAATSADRDRRLAAAPLRSASTALHSAANWPADR